jgi:putative aminopeptidase FrvX
VTAPDLLLRLLETPGPSGAEQDAARVWREAANAFAEVSGDHAGNSFARVRGTGGRPVVALLGHLDEIGFIVTHVDDDGRLWFRGVGGWLAEVLLAQRVEILARDGVVPGVIYARRDPARREEKRALKLKDLFVDIGARNADEARQRVRLGDVGVIAVRPLTLANGRLASRALDNRLGVYVALEAARRVSEAGGGAGPVAAVAAVQEEIGAHGARAMAFGLEPDVAIVVDVTHATDVPGVEAGQLGDHGLGDGPVLTRGAIVSARINRLLDEAAEAEGIAITTEVAGRATHTDADSIHLSRAGVPTAILSIPLRYMHSPVELVELADVEAAIALISAFALRLEEDTSLARW